MIEAKSSQPAFPGQPPPLQDARRIEASSPAFPGQPPPRQSSQPRSQVFPGSSAHYSSQSGNDGYANNYSPSSAPSPGNYNNVQSPQDNQHYHSSSSQNQRREERERHQRELERQRIEQDIRERQKEKERQERHRIAEERREQERIRQEQEFRREQERIRQEREREERLRKEQEEKKKRERERQEQERLRREEEKRKREEQERRRKEEEKRREQERIRQEQERIRQEQERIAQERKMQEERDLGLARLSAMGALNDLGEDNNGYNSHYDQQQEQSNFNLNMFNQYQQNMIKQEQEQKPLVNQFNNWINRANELLDLSSSDSRDTSQNDSDTNNFIPQILMNPWDPQQSPMMTFAPIANAMQQYQQQWLSQYHQAIGNDEGSFPLGKFKTLCISPDEDMGFLINLPPPCNLLFQEEALIGKKIESPYLKFYTKFIKDPNYPNLRRNLTEAPDRPPPYIEPSPPPAVKQEIKKEYVAPYTPRATHDPNSKAKLSSSGYSRSIDITPVRRNNSSRNNVSHSSSSSRNSFSKDNQNKSSSSQPSSQSSSQSSSSATIIHRPKAIKRRVSEEEDFPDIPPERRESSRRKAKENLKSKLEAQEKMLMDDGDPTLNNPALDLDDSDDDAEWNPLKDAEERGNKRKRGGVESSEEEDEEDYSEFNAIHNVNNKKKRASIENGRKISNDTTVPEGGDFKVKWSMRYLFDKTIVLLQVGTFLILKSDDGKSKPPLWRVDGKTLIQKYESVDGSGLKYKCVNTYSGWTQNTRYDLGNYSGLLCFIYVSPCCRHRYTQVEVKPVKSSGNESLVEWIKEAAANGKSAGDSPESKKKEEPKPQPKKKINIE